MTGPAMRNDKEAARAERRGRLRRGRMGEFVAAALLTAKGYRIAARCLQTPYGEIDIVAVSCRRVAFVEVKRRRTREAAEAALTPHQASRIARAADWWLARHPRLMDREIGLDAVLVVPFGWPRHIPNALDRI